MTHILVSYLIRIMISPVHSESKTSLDLSNNIDNYLILAKVKINQRIG